MSQKRLPITGLPADGAPTAVLVCGDPARATRTAAAFDEATLLTDRREYRAFRGLVDGRAVAVCSHGVGAPGAAAAFEELIVAGARRLIRIGTCGGLQADIHSGDLVIATAAVQNTGYGREVAPDGYPAVADPALTLALVDAARANGRSPRAGIVLTRDAFYPGIPTPATPDYEQMAAANVLAVEMECAALFLLGNLRSVQTAAILAVDGNVLGTRESIDSYRPHRDIVAQAVDDEIAIALDALRRIDEAG